MNRNLFSLLLLALFVFSSTISIGQSLNTKTRTPADYPSEIKIEKPTAPSDFATALEIDFEVETAWSFVFTPWTVNDVDLLTTYGFTGTTFPGSGDPMAYIVFDPATTDPPMTEPEIQAHSGTQFGACMASVPASGQGNDDWFISDLVAITASGASFTFWAKSYTADYGLEQFNVGVSTSGNSPGDFSIISGSSAVSAPTTWTEYTYDLSSYVGQSIYVAIQCVSYDAFVFMIDDLVIDPDGGGGGGATTCDDFENLNVGDYVAVELPDWTTWSNSPGSAEDAQITNATASSGTNAFQVDGTTDLVRLFNSTNYYNGEYEFSTMINVASGNCGYFNLQKDVVAGTEWGFEVQFDADGVATVNAGAEAAATFNFSHNTWHLNEITVDLDNNSAEYYFNGSLIVSWQWSLGANGTSGAISLGSANFYAWASTGNSPLAYFDDVCFEDISVFEPDIYVNPTAITINIGTTKKSSIYNTTTNWDASKITDEYVPGKILVKFHDVIDVYSDLDQTNNESINALNKQFSVSNMSQVFQNNDVNAALKMQFGLSSIFELQYDASIDIVKILQAYASNPYVVYAEPDYIYHTCIIPPDPMYPDQWGLNNTGQAVPYGGGGTVGTPGADINAELAWDIQTGSSTLIVSIIDEGVDLSHPEFAGRLLPGYDYYDNDPDPSPVGDGAHGTACAGIAAAANDGVGVVGVSWNVQILPVRVLGPSGGSSSQVANGITFSADEGADVLSLSLGGTGFSSTMESAVNYAYATDAIILSAAGNDNSNNTITPHYPSDYANSISVGALSPCNDRKTPSTCDGETWWGSNYAGTLDFMAPGVRIYTTDISGSAGYTSTNYTSSFNGTSSACPFAAGVAALIRSENSSLTNDQVWDIMQTTCVDLGATGYDEQTGYGRLDAYEALLSAGGSTPINTFNIQNIGNSLLSISSITDDKDWLSTSGYPTTPFDITPGGGEDITVDIDWVLLGNVQQTGTITIASNDPDEPSAYVTVTAIPGPAPDLEIQNHSISPTTVNAGAVTVSICTVANIGDTLADASLLEYYLSTDTIYDPADTYLAEDAVGSLAIGGTSPQTEDLTIPVGTAAGSYYVLFFADAEDVIEESNEDNNVAWSQLEVTENASYLSVEPSIKDVGYEQGSFTANVTSNIDWEVVENCDWLSCDPTSGQNDATFAVLYEENITGSIRSCTITVSGDGLSDNLIVNQDFAVSISENKFGQEVEVYPNPFSSQITIAYVLAEPEMVEISILNHQGEKVDIIREDQEAGNQKIVWNAKDLPNGMYFYRIEAGGNVALGKILHVK